MKFFLSIALVMVMQQVCFRQQASAQTIDNGTSLFIAEGIQLHAPEGLTNSAFLQNSGAISLTGDWLNKSTYQGTGSVELNGSGQQLSNNDQSIETLIINGAGTKTLAGRLIINKQIFFQKGILMIAAADELILNTNCTAEGGSPLSYVNGALISRGSGYKFYPVGKNGKYIPLELVDIKGASPVISVEAMENLPEVETSSPATLQRSLYWKRTTLEGTFTGSPVAMVYSNAINERTIIAEGDNVDNPFVLHTDNFSQSRENIQWLNSSAEITKEILVTGELLADLPAPYYFSTTLSSQASAIENRSVKIFGDQITADGFYFQVFNRWGLPLFESKSYADMSSSGWEGKQHGTMLPSGVYPYSLRFTDTSGKAIQQTGFITIIN